MRRDVRALRLPTNPIAGISRVALPGFLLVYLVMRSRFYDHIDAMVIALCAGFGSGVSVACYYLGVRFLWHDFGEGADRSLWRRLVSAGLNIAVLMATAIALFLVVQHQNEG